MIPIHHTDKQRIHRGWCDRVPHSDRNLLFIVRRHVLHVNGNANTHLQNTLAILPDVHSHMVCKLFLLRRADVPANPTYPSASILSRTLCYRSEANHLASLVLAHHTDVQNALIRHVVNVCHDQGNRTGTTAHPCHSYWWKRWACTLVCEFGRGVQLSGSPFP